MKGLRALAVALVLCSTARAGELEERQARWQKEAGKPSAVLAVAGLLELRDREDVTALDAFLARAAADPKAHPLARSYAQFAAEVVARKKGDSAGAAELRKRLGLVETWRVIGPFSNTSSEGFARVFPPEERPASIDLAAKPQGKKRPVAWREVPARAVVSGTVPIGAMLRPDDEATAYALAYVHSERAQDVAVRIGSTGPVKVWIDGALVLSHDVRRRSLRPDQDAAPARLGAGWHVVLVKTTVDDGPWAFRLRFSTPAGDGVALKSALDAGGALAAPERSKTKIVTVLPTLKDKRDVARYHAFVSPEGEEGSPVEETLEQAPRDAAALVVLMRHGESADGRRRAAEALVAKKEHVAEAATALATHYSDDAERPGRADELLLEALAADRDHWPAALALARRLSVLDLVETAHARLVELARRHPRVADLSRELASLERRRGRAREAEKILAALLEERKGDVSILADLAELAEARGDAAAAVRFFEAMSAARPDSVVGYQNVADARKRAGAPLDAIVKAYDEGLALAPEDDRLLEASGRLLVDRGKKTEGLARLKQALALRPQNPELRRMLGRLDPAFADDLEDQYAKKPRAVRDRWQGFRDPESDYTVLSDLKVTRVHDNGLSEVFVQRIFRIDEESAAEAQRIQEIQYTPSTQTLELRSARVYKKTGEVVESAARSDREVSEPWYGLYYDVRAESVRFARLEPGDVVELAYVIADVGRRNLLSDYFGDLYFFAEGAPRAESEYVLLAPPTRKIFMHVPPVAKQTIDQAAGEKRWRFRAERVARVESEERMPGWTETLPYLHVSTYERWDQVARWYWGLVQGQLVADEAIKKAARDASAKAKTVDEKVRAIHNLVVKKTRYVGLEFGIHGYKPYRVPLIFQRKFGDCKDKASLIAVMLREVGVKAYVVLVRTRRNGAVGDEPASLSVFDHAIAYVPELDRWLDGTAEFSGSTELPSEDQGVSVLVVDGGDGKFTTTPVLPAADNASERRLALAVDAGGAARVEEDSTVRGQGADDLRRYYQSPGERRSRYEKAWNGWFPGAKLDAIEMPKLDALEQPVTLRARGTAPELGRAVEGGRSLPAIGRASELALRLARTSIRKHDLVLDYPWREDETVVWKLPARVTAAPADKTIESPFGKLVMHTEAKEREATVHFTLEVTRRRIEKTEYGKFREFLVAVDAALNQTLEIGK